MCAIKSCGDEGKEEESVKLGILVGVSLTSYKALVWGRKLWTSGKKLAYTVVLAAKHAY